MTRFHIFGLQSRLGISAPPFGKTNLETGVEEGAETLIEALPDWLTEEAEIDIVTLPAPETSPHQLATVGTLYTQAKETLLQYWKPGQTAIFVGGDHSISLASVAAVQARFAEKYVAMVQFDSHGDLHLPTTSPSGNFHGMWLRAALELFALPEIDSVVLPKLTPAQLLIIGNLLIEPAEREYLTQNKVTTINSQDLQSEANDARQKVVDHIKIANHVHISFDIDVFSAPLVPGTGTPNPKGLTWQEIWPLLQTLRQTIALTGASLSLDIVEYNPKTDLQQKTLNTALEVIDKIFG